MKYLTGAAVLAASTLLLMSCCDKTSEPAYIGPSDIRIENGKMTPEVLLSLGRLGDPQLSPDGQFILYGVSYTSIADNRSCRNLFLCKADGSDKVQLTRSGKSISNGRWSADGKAIWYLCGGQVYKAPFKAGKLGKAVKITDVPSGIGEFSLSPDNAQMLYVSTVPGPVKHPSDFDPALDKAKAYVTEDLMYRHWDHWVEELPQTYLASTGNGLITPDKSLNLLGEDAGKFELPMEPFGGLEQTSWSPDGTRIAYSCKKLAGKEYAFSTDTDIFIYDIPSGQTCRVPGGAGYDTNPAWSPDGSKLAWLSMARNGYEADQMRLMVASVSPATENQAPLSITDIRHLSAQLDANVEDPVWDADGQRIWFSALVDGLKGVFSITPEGVVSRLTPEDAWFDFGSPFGIQEDGTLLSSYCSMEFPTELVAIRPNGTFSQLTHENEHILSQLTPYKTEKRYVNTVDGKDMLTWVLFPPEFDPSVQYPAIEILLGGPQGALSQGWSYRWNYRLMAAQGYVVVLPNRRGTTAFGQEWCEQISGDYPGLNMQDYLSAAQMIKAEPYIGKLAACGASYGGYSVYYLAGVHGNTYDCFIAHAGIFDEKYLYYETEEMWFPNWDNGGLQEYAFTPGQMGPAGDGITFGGMKQAGSPWSNLPKPQRHYANSPAANVTAWHTPILCIHGMMDFRIPYDQGMAAFNTAQMMGVPSKLVVFPEENHWILKPQNALFWHRTYFDWLDKWCKS